MSRFLTPLQVEEVDEFSGLWELTAPLRYQSDLLGRVVEVPTGFVTDFASIPRLPFIYLAAGGKGDRAAVIHDYAYSAGSAGLMAIDRATADAVLKEALLSCGYSAFLAQSFYLAVRAGGSSHWNAPNVEQLPHVEEAMEGTGG